MQSVFLCCFCKMLKSSVNLPICRRHQATADLLYFLCVNHERQDVSKTSKFFFSKWVTATGSFFPFLIQSRFSSQTAPIVNGVTTNKNLFSLGRFQLKYFTRNDLFPLRFQIIALTGIYTGYLTFQHCHLTFETCINFEVFKPRYL